MRVGLAVRALVFVALLPGTVAVYVPYRMVDGAGSLRVPDLAASAIAGVTLFAVGAAVLLRCVWDFFAAGHGTLAPVDPPKHLVVRGLYRITRNPMYNGVIAMLFGEALMFWSDTLVTYAAVVFVGFHLFVVLYEEPTLASRFGDAYVAYRRRAPRWGFTIHPYRDA